MSTEVFDSFCAALRMLFLKRSAMLDRICSTRSSSGDFGGHDERSFGVGPCLAGLAGPALACLKLFKKSAMISS